MVEAMPDARKYSDDEVREILERALTGENADPTSITHGDLVAIGEQVGLTPEAMARAAREVTQAKLDGAATRSLKSRRRKLLGAHAALYAVINALLFTVNFLSTPGEWWFLFSVVFWGLALAAHAAVALGLGVSARSLERERRKLAARPEQQGQKLRIETETGTPEVVPQEHAHPAEESKRGAARS
jgi:plasmid stability protein